MLAFGKVWFSSEDLKSLIGVEGDNIYITDVIKTFDGNIEITFVSDRVIEDVTEEADDPSKIRRRRLR